MKRQPHTPEGRRPSSGRSELKIYRARAEFRHQIRRFLRFTDESARLAGLEGRQHELLVAIKGLPGTSSATVGRLARRLQVKHHSAVELIDRSEERRLVERVRDSSDRRRVLVKITPKGERLLRRLSPSHQKELRVVGRALVRALAPLID